MQQAIFTVIDNGIEGKDKDSIVFASTNEDERDKWYNNHPSKAWYRKDAFVGDVDKLIKKFINQLDGIGVMCMENWAKNKYKKSESSLQPR